MTALPADGLPPLREVVKRYDLDPKKSLGQNFLFDLNLTGKIARAAGPFDGVTVLEIGPGPGGLTRALLAQGVKRVVAIERDQRCLAALTDIQDRYPERLTVVEADAMTIDPSSVGSAGEPLRIVSNLPYNIGTALLVKWIESDPWPPVFDRLVLMFQREVAERIVATPSQRAAYGRLAVLCGWRTQAKLLFDVPPSAFTPPPKVMSTVVELVPRAEPLPCSAKALSALTFAAFGQRRKMLRQSLRNLPPLTGVVLDPQAILEAAGIEGTKRPEEIDVAGFIGLTIAWQKLTVTPR